MEENKSSGLAVASMVIGIISFLLSCCYGGILGIIGLILGIVSVAGHKGGKGMAIAGIIMSALSIAITLLTLLIGISALDEVNKRENSTETTTEEIATEEITTEESTEIDIDELKANAEEVTYEDIYRNPETWKGKYIKIIVHVDEYETKFWGLLDTYYCSVNNQPLLVTESRKIAEPTIASGDTVLIYGKGAGMAILTESQKNILGIKTSKEESKIPNIDMYAAELQ